MKKSLFALAMACAALSCAVAGVVRETVNRCEAGLRRSWRWVVDLVLAPFAVASAAVVKSLPGPAVALIAAKLYQLRQIKREKPQLSPTWRMCPSS